MDMSPATPQPTPSGLATLYCRAAIGVQAPLVTVEVHLANGLPAFSIVGLPEKAVQESRERVRGALVNSGFEFPMRRITVNLAPADLPKEGGRFDLAIAIGILAASGQIPRQALARLEFYGELALSGEIRPVQGLLPAAIAAGANDNGCIVPSANGEEAALARLDALYPAAHLLSVCGHLSGQQPLSHHRFTPSRTQMDDEPDLAEVRGQQHAKRALEVAAAGGHNLLMLGPPGTGKSMLANRLPGILPPMTEQQALESLAVRSVAGFEFQIDDWLKRPFRAPHHTASGVALVGGSSQPRPGEISLAHHGVLFLDELPEFDRRVLEVLREPMESGKVIISRAARQAEFPARFQLIAAMNPCPCGHLGDLRHNCRCTAEQVSRYRARVSGPLLDRIDIQIEVPALPGSELTTAPPAGVETSAQVRNRVSTARELQLARQGKSNDELSTREITEYCAIDKSGQQLLQRAVSKLGLSPRAYHRVLKLARTVADLGNKEQIDTTSLTEAIGYRRLDRASVVLHS